MSGNADNATSQQAHGANCVFCNIIAGRIASRTVYEDTDCFAFHDINPAAPVHFLIVPKAHIESLSHLATEHTALLGRMLALAPKLAEQQGCRTGREGGFRVVINTGIDGGQEVFHLHIHVMGGQRPWKHG